MAGKQTFARKPSSTMDITTSIAWIAPPALILWRRRREPRWLACARYILAVVAVWNAVAVETSHETLIRLREAAARGDVEGMAHDTGANVAALWMGWIPGGIYAATLGIGRRLGVWIVRIASRREDRKHAGPG